VPIEAVTEGLNEGRRLARVETGIELSWCYDIPVRDDPEGGMLTARLALDHPADGLVSLGLGGAEVGYPREHFREAFALAASVGLRSVPHAGEADGPLSIWQAVRALGAHRIGHGIRAVDDPVLLDYLVHHRIPLEVCPVSNVRTRVVASLAEHPLRRLLDAGVVVTLNSDDPPMFGTSLSNEYLVAGTVLGVAPRELGQISRNGVRAAFISDYLAGHGDG
jgi:aminodeoxyfutalosine deaminase